MNYNNVKYPEWYSKHWGVCGEKGRNIPPLPASKHKALYMPGHERILQK